MRWSPFSTCHVYNLVLRIWIQNFGLILIHNVVPKPSAVVPGALDAEVIAIPADHVHMTKYRSEDDGGYKKVSGNLFLMARESSTKVEKNWQREEHAIQRT